MNPLKTKIYVLMAILITGGVSACDKVPYILDSGEFNRNAAGFGKDPTDISDVTICYSETSTTPDAIRAMAKQACAEFGKTAHFVDQDYLSCPLTTPVGANYVCKSPQSSTGSGFYQY